MLRRLSIASSLERYFEFDALGTDWRTEMLAGTTTFMTMAYIVFVNPSILAQTGMPYPAVVAATCLSAAFGSILMGALARYPIALAPGMGLNAYFAYAVVKGLGVPWQTALGAVFLSGVAFLILTAVGVRQLIVEAIPFELYSAVAAGIGLFIAFIGLRNAGIVEADPATLVTIGNLRRPETLLALFGLAATSVLMVWRVRAAMLTGILLTAAAGLLSGQLQWQPRIYGLRDLQATAFQLDIGSALKLGLLEIVFVFLFVDLFDNVGTLVAVGKRAGLFDSAHKIRRVNRILVADASATVVGSLAGTSTVVSYIESAAGVVAGGRSGVTAIVAGVLFLLALGLAPVMGAIPPAATAPALILVGSMMLAHVAEIDWQQPLIAIPAFLTMISIPLTFSIANGLALGFVAYTLLAILSRQFSRLNWVMYLLAVLFLVRFWYLGKG